jgi:hypothetical protein
VTVEVVRSPGGRGRTCRERCLHRPPTAISSTSKATATASNTRGCDEAVRLPPRGSRRKRARGADRPARSAGGAPGGSAALPVDRAGPHRRTAHRGACRRPLGSNLPRRARAVAGQRRPRPLVRGDGPRCDRSRRAAGGERGREPASTRGTAPADDDADADARTNRHGAGVCHRPMAGGEPVADTAARLQRERVARVVFPGDHPPRRPRPGPGARPSAARRRDQRLHARQALPPPGRRHHLGEPVGLARP